MEQRIVEKPDALTVEMWQKYPSRMASLHRQELAHDRAVKRKKELAESGFNRPITNRRAKIIKMNERRASDRKARHAKHAMKI